MRAILTILLILVNSIAFSQKKVYEFGSRMQFSKHQGTIHCCFETTKGEGIIDIKLKNSSIFENINIISPVFVFTSKGKFSVERDCVLLFIDRMDKHKFSILQLKLRNKYQMESTKFIKYIDFMDDKGNWYSLTINDDINKLKQYANGTKN